MARGQKWSDEIKEKAYLMYATCGNFNEVSRELGVPITTIKHWIDKKEPDELDELRNKKKEEFVDKASSIIDKGLLLLEKRLDRALNQEEELDELIEVIDEDVKNGTRRQALISKVQALQLQKLGEVTTAIGTLYDKRALAKGESTENTTVTFDLPEELRRFAR